MGKKYRAKLSLSFTADTFPFLLVMADSARPPQLLLSSVFRRKFVTIFTVGFSFIFGASPFTAQQVLFDGHRLQVCRVDTMPNSAQVVDNKLGWNRVYKQQICNFMGSTCFGKFAVKMAVALRSTFARPFPTGRMFIKADGGHFHLSKESSENAAVSAQSVIIEGSHFAKVISFCDLARLGSASLASVRAVSILPYVYLSTGMRGGVS